MNEDFKWVALLVITFITLIAAVLLSNVYESTLRQDCIISNSTRPGLEVLAICRGIK